MTSKRETALTALVLAYLRACPDTFAYKVHGGPYQRAGLPDIHVCVRGRCAWLEVKLPGEVPTVLQARTMTELERAGAICGVVRSVDDARRLVEPLFASEGDRATGGPGAAGRWG